MVFKKFKTLIIASTIPTLIGTALLLFFMYSDIVKAVSVGLACALVVGLVLILEALFFNRFSSTSWGITIVQFIVLPFTGLFLAGLAFIPAALAPQGVYVQLEPPPEIPTHFVQGSQLNIFGSKIYVQTASGQTYLYDCINYQGCSWIQEIPPNDPSDTNSMPYPDYCHPDRKGLPFVPPIPPMDVVDRLFVRHCGPDFEIYARYLLLRNGKLYYWYRYWNPLEVILGVPVFGFLGFISGVSTAIATSIRRKKAVRLAT